MASEEEVVIDLRKMRIPELKKELQLRSLKTTGNKQELIDRLQQYLEEHEGAEVADDEILKGDDDEGLLSDDKKLEDAPDDSVLAVPADEIKIDNEKTADVKKEAQVPEPKSPETKHVTALKSPASLTDKEKLEVRAKKFGMTVQDMNLEARKSARAARFGSASIGVGSTPSDPEKLKKRAERFGGGVSEGLTEIDEEKRKRKRQERFGNTTSASAGSSLTIEAKKSKRAERFGLSIA